MGAWSWSMSEAVPSRLPLSTPRRWPPAVGWCGSGRAGVWRRPHRGQGQALTDGLRPALTSAPGATEGAAIARNPAVSGGDQELGGVVPLGVVDGVVGPATPQDAGPAGGEPAEGAVVVLTVVVTGLAEGGGCPRRGFQRVERHHIAAS